MASKISKINKAKYADDIEDSQLDDFNALFQKSLEENNPKESTIVKGVIVNMTDEFIYVDIGAKSEGKIDGSEFGTQWKDSYNIGDLVDVYIDKLESRSGATILSREKALREEIWFKLEEMFKKGENVEGIIFSKVKGGFGVDLDGVIAFLPGSQVDVRPIKDISPLIGIRQPFQIFKIDRKQGNIVVSRRAILEESRAEARDEMLSQIHEGMVVEGNVKNITDYGAFIDLGSLDGLLHVTDISWARITHPSEVLSIGQQIKVMIIKYNQETKRISLGMKQLDSNPWSNIEEMYPKGTKITKKISNLTDYGAFVDLGNGIEGLIHVSEISWSKNTPNPKKILTIGQEVECVVLEVDSAKQRISLGIKQCAENPWATFQEKHPVGSIVEGEIKNTVEFGIFVGFTGDIDGLIHINDISWDSSQNEAKLKSHKKGDMIQAKVLSVDANKERISLGLKQLEEDTQGHLFENIKKNDTVKGKITEITDEYIAVIISDTINAQIKRTDLAKEKSEQDTKKFNVDDVVEAKVTNIDQNTRKLTLSIRALEIDEHKKVLAEYSGSKESSGSLGDLLGEAFKSSDNK